LFIVGNRALDDPGAFGVEHNDALALRDMGWLLCWASTAQEALEHVLIGYRIAEDNRVRMPMALAMDGAFLTHSQHMVKLPTQEAVRRFLPPYDLGNRRLHPDNPVSIAPQVNEDWVMELRRQNWEAARRAKGVVAQAYKEYNAIFGSRYTSPYFDEFMTEDAEVVLLGLGAVAMPARTAVRRLREKGKKVGYVNLRWFRPFPTEELRAVLGRMKAVGVIDRNFAHGSPDSGGIVVHDIRSCLYPLKDRPAIADFIGGLGGRDISIDDCIRMLEVTAEAPKRAPGAELVTWVGLRE
jgi:pyruvate ferredoxin oxidoreductase alpha subunit